MAEKNCFYPHNFLCYCTLLDVLPNSIQINQMYWLSLPKTHTHTHTHTHTIWYFKESRIRWAIGHFKFHFLLGAIFAPHPNIFSPPLHLLSCLIICAQALCFPLDYVAQVERPWLIYLYSPFRIVLSRNTWIESSFSILFSSPALDT